MLIMLLSACLSKTAGQGYQFEQYSTSHGLAQSETKHVLQDQHGLLWIGTKGGGVSSFDGVEFVNYSRYDGLFDNHCSSLFEDSKGRIWVGSEGGGINFIYDGQVHRPGNSDIKKYGKVGAFVENSKGIVYAFCHQAILKYEIDTFEVLENSDSDHYHPSSAVMIDDNQVILTSLHHGVLRIHLEPYYKECVSDNYSMLNGICYKAYIDNNDNIWVGSYGVLYRIGDTLVEEFVPDYDAISIHRIYGITQINDSTLLLGFEGNGIAFFDLHSKEFEIINIENGLPSRFIYQVFQDREENIWLTTYSEGIIKFRSKDWVIFNQSHGLPSDLVRDAIKWNNLWAVGTDGGLALIEGNEIVQTLFTEKEILGLTPAEDGSLLLGTNKGVIKLMSDLTYTPLSDRATHILLKDDTYTYIGEPYEIRDLSLSERTYHITRPEQFTVRTIGDRPILGTTEGIWQIVDNQYHPIPGMNQLQLRGIRSMENISPSSLVAVANRGLVYLSLESDTFNVKIHGFDQLGEVKEIYSIAKKNNHLWMASNEGLYKLDLDKLLDDDTFEYKYFSRTRNLFEAICAPDKLRITEENEVAIPTTKGLIMFDEKHYRENSTPPVTKIKQVLLFGQNPIPTQSSNLLKYNQNYISFEMQAINLTSPGSANLSYKLDGKNYSSGWSEPTHQNHVQFPFLNPDHYTFSFKASNGNGVWSKSESFTFAISKPFWQTSWFRFFSISLTSLLLILGPHYYYRHRQKKQEDFARNLLKGQEQERTRVARDLHDGVGQSLMLLAKRIGGKHDFENHQLAIQTLDELRSVSQGLHPSTLKRLGLTAAIQALVLNVDEFSDIFFTSEIAQIDGLTDEEASIHIYRIVQEALSNIVKHSQAKSAAIKIKRKEDAFTVEITDSGIGFNLTQKSGSSDSLGIQTLRERAKIVGAKLTLTSNEKGTRLYLEKPISLTAKKNQHVSWVAFHK